jgi:hypothetical protein
MNATTVLECGHARDDNYKRTGGIYLATNVSMSVTVLNCALCSVELTGSAIMGSGSPPRGTFSVVYMTALRCSGTNVVYDYVDMHCPHYLSNFVNNTIKTQAVGLVPTAMMISTGYGRELIHVVFYGNSHQPIWGPIALVSNAPRRFIVRDCVFDSAPGPSAVLSSIVCFYVTKFPPTIAISDPNPFFCAPWPSSTLTLTQPAFPEPTLSPAPAPSLTPSQQPGFARPSTSSSSSSPSVASTESPNPDSTEPFAASKASTQAFPAQTASTSAVSDGNQESNRLVNEKTDPSYSGWVATAAMMFLLNIAFFVSHLRTLFKAAGEGPSDSSDEWTEIPNS